MATTSYTPNTPGVLDETDFVYCFQISGVIWDMNGLTTGTATIHDGFGAQLSLTDIGILQANLRARLVALDTVSVTEIQNCIVQWFPLRFNTAEMDQGAVGSTTGLKYDPAKKRDQILKIFSGMTGCLSMASALLQKKRAMDGEKVDDGMIGVRRG